MESFIAGGSPREKGENLVHLVFKYNKVLDRRYSKAPTAAVAVANAAPAILAMFLKPASTLF